VTGYGSGVALNSRLVVNVVAVWQIIIIICIALWDRYPIDRARLVVVEESGRDWWCNDGRSNAEHLTRVDVVAIIIDIRIVLGEDGRVEAELGEECTASVVCLDYVGLSAVLASSAKAKILSGFEVAAGRVDDAHVHSSELISRDILGFGYPVTDITVDNSVVASAISESGSNESKRRSSSD